MGNPDLMMDKRTVNQMDIDVLIAGGGVAGSAAAAALAPLGLNILIIEPKASHGRRLAGELIHPPGIDALKQLGLLDDESRIGADIKGFSIYPYGHDADSDEPIVLPYSEVEGLTHGGMAIEHQTLKDHLLEKVTSFPGVDVWLGARVTQINKEHSSSDYHAIVATDGGEARINARLIIGADGPMSQVRKFTGIAHETHRYSGMLGVEVADNHLPNPGYGNIFLNPLGISYAYSVCQGRARVMFEILRGDDSKDSIREHLKFFPSEFRNDIEAAMAEDKLLAAANYRIVPETNAKANIALLGDARGCCHPLTASGITTAVKDALSLRNELIASRFDVHAALRRYAIAAGRVQLTRRTLSEELREAFLSHTDEAKLLNQCIFSYWRNNRQGRAKSLALLSTLDSSILSMGSQFAFVVLQAFRLLPDQMRGGQLGTWLISMSKLAIKSLSIPQAAFAHWLREQQATAK
jgi:2-polyprenyl-6-methoxyphenol hydroxylase-like FAD-dependent oxidoreductase